MDIVTVTLFLSCLTCALVTGFVLTFAVIVMPGLSKLGDKEFIEAFQSMDQIIQNNHPIFLLTWMGSIVSVLGAMVVGVYELGVIGCWPLLVIGLVYLIGVQGITVFIHLPLNSALQKIEVNAIDLRAISEQRLLFETRWNYFNRIRTIIAFAVTVALMVMLING